MENESGENLNRESTPTADAAWEWLKGSKDLQASSEAGSGILDQKTSLTQISKGTEDLGLHQINQNIQEILSHPPTPKGVEELNQIIGDLIDRINMILFTNDFWD